MGPRSVSSAASAAGSSPSPAQVANPQEVALAVAIVLRLLQKESALHQLMARDRFELPQGVGPSGLRLVPGTTSPRPTGSPTAAPSATLPVLRYGASGPAVTRMQRALNAQGYGVGAEDGAFGPRTLAALNAFKKAQGLTIPGVCGKYTWRALGKPQPVNPVSAPSGSLRQRIVTVARNELGTMESGDNQGAILKYPRAFGRGSEAWCADFVSWVNTQAGNKLDYAYCPYLEAHLKATGRWKGPANPQPGDTVLFDFHGRGHAEHTGIVESVNSDGSVNTIEGNASLDGRHDGVLRHRRPLSVIRGFGNP